MSAITSDPIGIDKSTENDAEAARQFALERYDVLDSPEEFCFDHIVKAVAMELDVPLAAISLMDGERLWFKSKIGFDVTEFPRNTAFCNYTISQNSPTIIEDTARDARFINGASVGTVLSLQSYIGVPLTTPDGHNIGTLCAGDIVPRKFRHSKIILMQQLAELVIHELELRQRADRDRLTGALSRSGFCIEVQKAITLYDRQKIISTLVLFDVDLYTMVGHRSDGQSGSALLRTIIQSLVVRLKDSDCVGRLGGTLFGILLTAATHPKARSATEEVLKRMEQANAGVFLDLSFTEVSPQIAICDDWLMLANNDLDAAKKVRPLPDPFEIGSINRLDELSEAK